MTGNRARSPDRMSAYPSSGHMGLSECAELQMPGARSSRPPRRRSPTRYGHQQGGQVAPCFAPFHPIQAEGRELRPVTPRPHSGKEAPAEYWEIARGRCDPGPCRDCRSGSRRSPAEQRTRPGNRHPHRQTPHRRRSDAPWPPAAHRSSEPTPVETTPAEELQDPELKVTRRQRRRTPPAQWGCCGAMAALL
jgi:hypothetical protein